MARRYPYTTFHPFMPALWLVSDARNDSLLEGAIARLPHRSGLILRLYHLPEHKRRARFRRLARLARARGVTVILSGNMRTARQWGADGAYGAPDTLAYGPAGIRLVTVHSLKELARVRRASAVILSPVFATRSHPERRGLGPLRFRLLAAKARFPVIALGGMTYKTAGRLRWTQWAAIDGLSGLGTKTRTS